MDSRDARDSSVAPRLAAARRGRVSERVWADVRIAARVARDEGVALRVHGINVQPINTLKQHGKAVSKVPMPKAEAAQGKQATVPSDESSPRPPSQRKQRQARRLEEFHQRKRVAAVAEKVAAGVAPEVAKQQVARDEQMRLEVIAAAKAKAASAEAAQAADSRENGMVL